MGIKYIVTKLGERLMSATFSDGICTDIDFPASDSLTGNVYIGRVENVVKNINCAFVEVSKGVKCYYPLDEKKRNLFLNRKNNTSVNQGDFLLVQVSKEAVKTKPATVSEKIELSGKYVVLSSDVRYISISSKTKKDDNCINIKKELKEELSFNVCEDGSDIGAYGLILRSSCVNATIEECRAEAHHLIEAFRRIVNKARYGKPLTLLYKSVLPVIKKVNDIPDGQLDEIITDIPEIYDSFMDYLSDNDKKKLRFYEDAYLPLYKLYELEKNVRQALNKKIWLKCGGYLVIEQTEALSVIDVNSGKCVSKKKGADALENTFYKVNTEAAVEIARQLRLRNLSGIIVIDFINMSQSKHNEELISLLKKELAKDCSKASFADITKLGLVELTRERNGKSLKESFGQGEKWLYEDGEPL